MLIYIYSTKEKEKYINLFKRFKKILVCKNRFKLYANNHLYFIMFFYPSFTFILKVAFF